MSKQVPIKALNDREVNEVIVLLVSAGREMQE